jgi:hypothetical protein
MDEPRLLRVVPPNRTGEAASDPDDLVTIPEASSSDAITPEENPWASAFHAERSGHPSARPAIPDPTHGRASNTDRRLRAYLHLVEGP